MNPSLSPTSHTSLYCHSTLFLYNQILVVQVSSSLTLTIFRFIAKLSQRVKLRSSNEGQQRVEARHDDAEFFHKTFPFFIWLLRDVTLRPPSDCKDIKEYFLKRVLFTILSLITFANCAAIILWTSLTRQRLR